MCKSRKSLCDDDFSINFIMNDFLNENSMIDASDRDEVDHAPIVTADQIFGDECVD